MLVWTTFILVPIIVGMMMLVPKSRDWNGKAILLSQSLGNLLLVVFLLTALYQFGDMYNRVVFYEFLVGCGVSLLVLYVVNRWNKVD